MTDPLIDNLIDTVGDQKVGRELPRALTPFKHPTYRKLALALVFGAFAQGVWLVALVWEVFRIGGSTGDLSLVSGASAVGVIIPALVAGVVADRVPQKLILVGVAVVETAGMLTISTFAYFDLSSVALLALISFVVGMALSFYYPAYSAMLPSVVPEQDLMAVNGFEGMVRPTIGSAIGPGVAGLVVGASAPHVALFVATASMALTLLTLTTVPRLPVRRDLAALAPGNPVRSALSDISEGFSYMRRTPWLMASLFGASICVLAMMGPLEVLLPVLIKEDLDGTASHHAWVLAAFGIGGAVGSFTMASRAMPRRYLTVLVTMWAAAALPFIAVAHAQQIWIVVAAGAVMGFLFSAPMVIWGTLLQRRVPPELLGRVSSLDFFVSISLMPLSMALVGPVSAALGKTATFWIAALLPAAALLVAWIRGRLSQDEINHPLV